MSFKDRVIGALKLDMNVYKEIGGDTKAINHAVLIVALSGLATGIGAIYRGGIGSVILAIIASLAGWYVCSIITYYIGVKLLPETETSANKAELLRIIAFAGSPALIRVLGLLPGSEQLVFFITSVWMLVALVMTVRMTLQYKSIMRAIGVCIPGWIILALIVELSLAI